MNIRYYANFKAVIAETVKLQNVEVNPNYQTKSLIIWVHFLCQNIKISLSNKKYILLSIKQIERTLYTTEFIPKLPNI